MNETLVRALSGAVYVVLLVTATLYSRESLLLLFGLFLLQSVSEFSKLIKINTLLALLLAVLSFLNFSYFNSSNFNNWLLGGISIFTIFFLTNWLFTSKIQILNPLGWGLLVGYIIIPFILITKLGVLGGNHYPHFIIAIFILIWTNDTFAYLVGRQFGKTKLLEKISPKKTIEGFVGGVVFAVVASIFIGIYYVTLLPLAYWIVIALIASFAGTIGDLVESKFKRIANVKDSGAIMPGHGGILDRLDSIIFAAPIVYLFLKIVEYVS